MTSADLLADPKPETRNPKPETVFIDSASACWQWQLSSLESCRFLCLRG